MPRHSPHAPSFWFYLTDYTLLDYSRIIEYYVGWLGILISILMRCLILEFLNDNISTLLFYKLQMGRSHTSGLIPSLNIMSNI